MGLLATAAKTAYRHSSQSPPSPPPAMSLAGRTSLPSRRRYTCSNCSESRIVGLLATAAKTAYKLAEKEATLETKLANRTVVKHPGVEKPADFKPYVPPAPKEKKGRPCLLYTSPSPRDLSTSRMPSSA